jgi:hypothetical protein
MAVVYLDPFAGDWDALDYTVLALKGEPSSMILGRMLFIFANRALFKVAHALFGLTPAHAYLLFKYVVLAQCPLAVIAWWKLAFDLSASKRAATAAALLLGLSPFFVVYSGQAMTEIPSLLLLAIALIIHLRGIRQSRLWLILTGACLLGLCVNLREGAALYAPWLAIAPLVCGWRFDRRYILTTLSAGLLFALFAFGPFAFWYWLDINYYRRAWQGWAAATRIESARHPVTIANFKQLLRHFFFAGPLLMVGFFPAAYSEIRRRGLTPLVALAALGFAANLSLIIHYSVVLNGRYMLTGIPAIAPLVGAWFVHEQTEWFANSRRAFASVVIGILFIAGVMTTVWPISWRYIMERSLAKDYIRQLELVPRDAVIIPGSQTVAVTYWQGIGEGDWHAIGTGVNWPGPQLRETISGYLASGKRVFVDTDPRWWSPCGWQVMEVRELAQTAPEFRFKQVTGTLYEIRPKDDPTALADPGISRLLPENRSEEVRFCSQ